MMRKISLKISLYMAITMSIGLSIIGNIAGYFLSGRNRPIPALIIGIIISFFIGFTISMTLSLLVPMKNVGEAVCRKAHTSTKTLKGRILTSLVSDLIYTPLISTAQVCFSYFQIQQEQRPPFVAMWLSSVLICMVAGYFITFIFQPLYMRKVFAKYGIEM